MMERICAGCHRPSSDTRPLCGECVRTAVRHADELASQDWRDDLWGRRRACVKSSRRDRRAAESRGGPKGQQVWRRPSLLPGEEG